MLAALDVDRQLRHEQDVAFQSALEVDLDRIHQEEASKESESEVEEPEMQQPLLGQESRAERAARFAAAFDKRASQLNKKQ